MDDGKFPVAGLNEHYYDLVFSSHLGTQASFGTDHLGIECGALFLRTLTAISYD
jgi:hypothetical protein